ncbi:ORF6N domain-containing protein [Phocaeicola sp.]|uniref:ORF6N domain-containing protein n=1 Tax=Phocaeicola sp. TaxID=2773926 RepID=UPI00307C2150
MFRISETEWENMSSQFVTTFRAKRPKTSLPYAFTEQGVTMLSAVLRSKPAIQVSISIMKATFCNLPRYLPSCWSYAVGCSWWNATAGRTWRL